MKDLIDREVVLEELSDTRPSPKDRPKYLQWLADNKAILKVPLVQPDLDEWCPDCKEYDSKRHCCPRLNRVIRTMLKDSHVIPERKNGKWIFKKSMMYCSECGDGFDVGNYHDYNFCPNCGCRMEGEEHD